MRWGRGVSVVSVLVLCVGVSAGCASSDAPQAGCVPRMSVEPRTVHPGDTVTLSSADECHVAVPDGGWWVEATIPSADGTATRAPAGDASSPASPTPGTPTADDSGLVRSEAVRSVEAFDGSWSVEVRLPENFPVGDAAIGIRNWKYTACPADASCAGPSTGFTVEP
jgi:hypothetical protein